MKQLIVFLYLVVCNLLLSTITYAHAHQFTNIYVFGDSLSDPGSSGPLSRHIDGRHNNLLYIDYLNQNYIKKDRSISYVDGGTNYAQTGAGIDQPSFMEEPITTVFYPYLKNHPKADENGIYILWIGANDLIQNMLIDDVISLRLITETGLLNTPLLEQSQYNLFESKTSMVANIAKDILTSGADYLIFPNIPDLSLTPLYVVLPDILFNPFHQIKILTDQPRVDALDPSRIKLTGIDYLKEYHIQTLQQNFFFIPNEWIRAYYESKFAIQKNYVSHFNKILLEKLSVLEGNIVYLDTESLFNELMENDTIFGFDDINNPSCTFFRTDVCRFDKKYAFKDLVHPSQHAHKIIADYFISVFDAPIYMSGLTKHLNALNTSNRFIINNELQNNRLNEVKENWHTFIGVSSLYDAKNNFQLNKRHHNTNNLYIGLIHPINQQFSIGAVIGMSLGTYKPFEKLSYDYRQQNISFFGQYHKKNGWLNLSLNLNILNANNIDRKIPLESNEIKEKSKTNGIGQSFQFNIGYDFKLTEKLTLIPYIGYFWQKNKIHAFREKANKSTSMHFNSFQEISSSIITGVQLTHQNKNTNSHIGINYNISNQNKATEIRAAINRTDKTSFKRMAINNQNNNWFAIQAGFNKKMTRNFLKDISLTGNIELQLKHKEKNKQIIYSVGLNKKF